MRFFSEHLIAQVSQHTGASLRELELTLLAGKGKSQVEGGQALRARDLQSPISPASWCTEVTSYDWVTAHDYLDLDMDLKPLHLSTKGGM